jgi:anti-sigma factor RsiW
MEALKRQHALRALTPARSELTCQEAVGAMDGFFSGALPPKRRLDVEQHLKNCAECAAFLRTYEKTIEATRYALTSDLPAPTLRLRKPPQDHYRAKLTDELMN